MSEFPDRLRRERVTIDQMIALYCREQHASPDGLCPDCVSLQEYTHQRLEKCVFGAEKPTCANCPVHCYRADMRAKVREVMRYAGPRMLLRHPVLTVRHLLDGRRAAPKLIRRAKPQDR
ncbi:nitrous oxide-stimulated promoter [Longilinea arvoryzae]|uniref:Nitrous oxide-stimulated promoter n=1 Tax=Longilinea arvoryzae TaxID=360412 RepID=A0A0S7BM91_9CHLR|nr:nitrous oxide-stimulated promoter family protein [Longilinea arvoryzae]GAP15638.1 nitrous oxide-stimulated promoter [Longilinea arvoryzae]